jgi:diguanylate cyclase (GGDEF)-like protein
MLGLLWLAVIGYAVLTVAPATPLSLIAVSGLLATIAIAVVIGRYQERLHGLVETDPLTGLANHRGFHDYLARELETAKRADGGLAVVILDLDNFKAINDTHGHSLGDEVLAAVAETIQASTRQSDLAGRVGGEEFGLVLSGADAKLAAEIAERLRGAVSKIRVGDAAVSCSVGFAVFPTDGEDGPTLCKLADGAMYTAKRAGKDRVRRFDPERDSLDWGEKGAAEIRAALDTPGAIEAVFQPVVSLSDGRLVGYEALARFPRLPDRPVNKLFAQAHGCGLGSELEAATLAAALEPLGRPPGTHLAVNLSPVTLASPVMQQALPDDLTDLVIELTEHHLFPAEDELSGALGELRERGALIAIDDIGAGYSGLQQLMRVGPDIVKLDRELTRAIHADPPRMALVESFVRFARRVGATVCAEGIEGLDDLTALANLDVEWGQGYALARPSPPWVEVSTVAAARCRRALDQAMRPTGDCAEVTAGDRNLERLSAEVASAESRQDLESALALVAAELNADKVGLSVVHRASGIIEMLAENGEKSLGERFRVEEYPLTASALAEQSSAQVLVSDPAADPWETELLLSLGHRSLLMVPVVHRGRSIGLIEALRREEEPWTRSEINRARIISNQFAAPIDAFVLDSPDAGSNGRTATGTNGKPAAARPPR